MDVDQTRHHRLARHVDATHRVLNLEVGADRHDPVTGHGHIGQGVDSAAGVDQTRPPRPTARSGRGVLLPLPAPGVEPTGWPEDVCHLDLPYLSARLG
jgi:hypothetical protein